MTFSRSFPALYVPLVERAVLNVLQGVPDGGEYEVVILPTNHMERAFATEQVAYALRGPFVGESDENPVVEVDTDDQS